MGDEKGFVHVCDLTTGKVMWSSEKRIGEEGKAVWLPHIAEHIVCGTGTDCEKSFKKYKVSVTFIDPSSKDIT